MDHMNASRGNASLSSHFIKTFKNALENNQHNQLNKYLGRLHLISDPNFQATKESI
jgi:hypothetical protein